MIYPRKNVLIEWFFDNYIKYITRKNFVALNYNPIATDPGAAVLLLANHYSWWDAFIFHQLNKKFFGRRFHIMILEETLKRVAFTRYLGAFSVKKGSRDVIASLNYAASLLADPQNLVLIFPQGRLYSNFVDRVVFENGAGKIIEKAGTAFNLVYAAAFTENFKYKRPSVTVYLQPEADKANFKTPEACYNRFYRESAALQTAIII